MTNKLFELKAQYDAMEKVDSHHIHETYNYYKKCCSDLHRQLDKVNNKQLLWLACRSEEAKQSLLSIKDKPEYDFIDISVTELDNQPTTVFNFIIWLKRYFRNYQACLNQLYEYQSQSREYLSDLKELKNELSQIKSKVTEKMIRKIDNIYRVDLLSSLNFEFFQPLYANFIDGMFINGATISKSEMLSLLTVSKDARVTNYINKLPDQIDERTFKEAIFVERIEHEDDEPFFWMIFNDVMAMREKDKGFAARMDKVADDLFDFSKLPTYSVTLDEFGQVNDVKRNPPNLRLV